MEFVFDEALTRADALETFRRIWKPAPAVQTVTLDRARGRVLAAELEGQFDLPVFRSSSMDGIAVRSADFEHGLPDTSGWIRGRDFAQADTGDDFADEFDATVAIENVEYDGQGRPHFRVGHRGFTGEVRPGQGVNPAGGLSKKGAHIAGPGLVLDAAAVAAAAVGGYAHVPVYARPVIAYIPTGSELVSWGSYPERGKNIEANSLLVKGMGEEMGAEVICYPVVKDDPAFLEAALTRALEVADIVIVNGGSSRGEEDYNSQMLQRRASWFVHGVRTVPARPVGMALVDGKPVVNAPGPVVGAWLCMDWLVRGLVAHWYGLPVVGKPRVKARLAHDMRCPMPGMQFVGRVLLEPDGEGGFVATQVRRSEGVPQNLCQAHGIVTIEPDPGFAEAGAEVEVELLRPLEYILG